MSQDKTDEKKAQKANAKVDLFKDTTGVVLKPKFLTKEEKETLKDLYKIQLREVGIGWKKYHPDFRQEIERKKWRTYDKATEATVELANRFIKEQKNLLPEELHKEEFSEDTIKEAHQILEGSLKDILKYFLAVWKPLHAGDCKLMTFEYLDGLTVVTEVKVPLWVIGKSGKGKSHSLYVVLMSFPRETYEVFTSSSPLAFHYYSNKYGKEAFKDKIIFIDEAEASKDTLPILRAFTGQTPINPRHLTVKEQVLLDISTEHKPLILFSSVHPYGRDEIKNRFVFINPDETKKQDERVYELQQKLRKEKGLLLEEEKRKLKVTRAMTRIILNETKNLKIIIPWKIDWFYKNKRFLYPMFISFVKSVTRVAFKQRKKGDKLKASKEDVEFARYLWTEFHRTIRYRVQDSAWKVWEALNEMKSLSKVKAFELRSTHSRIAEELELMGVPIKERQVENLCQSLFWENLVAREKIPSTGGAPPWAYWIKESPEPTKMEITPDEEMKE